MPSHTPLVGAAEGVQGVMRTAERSRSVARVTVTRVVAVEQRWQGRRWRGRWRGGGGEVGGEDGGGDGGGNGGGDGTAPVGFTAMVKVAESTTTAAPPGGVGGGEGGGLGRWRWRWRRLWRR